MTASTQDLETASNRLGFGPVVLPGGGVAADDLDPVGAGLVEPVDRVERIKAIHRIPTEPAAERFELWDPHAEVKHRAKTFEQMVSTAERSGAIRFDAIDADGKRTQVFKVDGQWVRGDREPRPKLPIKDEAERSPNVVPIVVTPPVEVAPNHADTDAVRKERIARLEAALNER